MKKTISLIVVGLFIGAAGAWAFICHFLPFWHRSAAENTYWQVSSKLDRGGEVFAYIYTEKLIESTRDFLAGLQKNMESASWGESGEARQVFNAFDLFLKEYGLSEISGIGYSSITLAPQLYRSRFVLHHHPGRDQGLLWNMLGSSPRALDEIAMLPAGISLATFSDYNLEKILSWVLKMGENSEQVTGQLEMARAGLAAAGIDLDRLQKSYAGRLGLLIHLDAEKRISLPLGDNSGLLLPEPGLALMIRVNDSYIFDLIREKLAPIGQGEVSVESGWQKIVFPAPPSPLPLTPTIAQKGQWLMLTTATDLSRNVFNDKKPRLDKNQDFRRLASSMPRRGNGFLYLSPALTRLAAQAMRENQALFPNTAMQEKLISFISSVSGFYQVWENSSSGLVYTTNHSFSPSSLLTLINTLVELGSGERGEDETEKEVPADTELEEQETRLEEQETEDQDYR